LELLTDTTAAKSGRIRYAFLSRARDVRGMLFVRYPEDGTLVRHSGGNAIMRAAQSRGLGCKTRFAEGWRTRQTFKIFSAGLCSAKRHQTPEDIEEHFSKPALFTFSLSLVCM